MHDPNKYLEQIASRKWVPKIGSTQIGTSRNIFENNEIIGLMSSEVCREIRPLYGNEFSPRFMKQQ